MSRKSSSYTSVGLSGGWAAAGGTGVGVAVALVYFPLKSEGGAGANGFSLGAMES